MNLPWKITEPLEPHVFNDVRHQAIFECCKWDPQVEDVCTLSPLPLVLTTEAWREISSLAEKLAQEAAAAESEVLQNPHLLKKLGLPWSLRRRLRAPEIAAGQCRHLRLVRFDFHFTTEGWRISEANSDVPGGFNEASGFTRLMAQHYGGMTLPGDPTASIAKTIGKAMGKPGVVALIHATSFTDDRQVMVFLAQHLEQAGHQAMAVAPDHLRWEQGRAFLDTDWARGPVDFVFRFFPAEWLPELPRRSAWWHLLGSSITPLCNPALTIVSQSKRFPLIWEYLSTRLPTWEKLLPKTFDVRDVPTRGQAGESLVFKPVFGRVGNSIRMHGLTPANEILKIDRAIRRYPKEWIAQERFEAVPLSAPSGVVYPCIGVYTLDGRVIGAYGRVGRAPLINHLAQDAAVLIAESTPVTLPNQTIHHEPVRTLQTLGA